MAAPGGGPRAGPADRTLADVERAHIEAVLDECGWRINGTGHAAEKLGLKPNTLRFRMKKLGIDAAGAPSGPRVTLSPTRGAVRSGLATSPAGADSYDPTEARQTQT